MNNLNTTSKSNPSDVTTYTYDVENQLIAINHQPSTINYLYDGLGRRIEKNINGTITRYVYDNEDIMCEYDGLNNLIAKYIHGPGIDEPLRMERGGQYYWYHTDGLGSITAIIDSSGAVVKTYQYDSFGNIVNETGSLINPYTYTGREFDVESGLYYYRSRYYDAKIGRFLQEDPIGFIGGLNLYKYADNNPVTSTDPLGLGPIKGNVKKELKKELGSYLSDDFIDRVATVFEEEAERLGKAGDLIANSLNPFRSKEKKREIQEKIGKEILDSLMEQAKTDPKLRELQDKLEEARRKKELENENYTVK